MPVLVPEELYIYAFLIISSKGLISLSLYILTQVSYHNSSVFVQLDI